VDIVEAQLKMVCESEEIHHPDCPQFTGPYDLGDLLKLVATCRTAVNEHD